MIFLNLGLGLATAFRWWRLADWFWHRKMDRFWKTHPSNSPYVDPNGKLVRESAW